MVFPHHRFASFQTKNRKCMARLHAQRLGLCARPILQQYFDFAMTFLHTSHRASCARPVSSQNGSAGELQWSHVGIVELGEASRVRFAGRTLDPAPRLSREEANVCVGVDTWDGTRIETVCHAVVSTLAGTRPTCEPRPKLAAYFPYSAKKLETGFTVVPCRPGESSRTRPPCPTRSLGWMHPHLSE